MKINKFKISDKYGREDIVIDKKTTIEPTRAPFEYRSQEDDLSISSLAHIAPEQLIAIKGYLAHLTGIKKVIIQGSEVPKQEGYITDPSGHIKIILWDRHADALQEGYTYFFNKVRIKVNQGQKYLNTPKQENECTIDFAAPFEQPPCTLDEVATTKDLIASILGISNINKYHSCANCLKKVAIKGTLAFCSHCKMSQKASACDLQWCFKIYVQNQDDPTSKIHLNVFGKQIVNKMFTLAGIQDNSSEDEVLECLLNMPLVKVCFDTEANKLIDIDAFEV